MINAILQGILKLILSLINLLLVPIDTLLSYYVPSLTNAFNIVNDFIDKLIDYVGFVISYTGLYSSTISVIISLTAFIYSVPLLVHGIKLSIKWYRALKG